MARHLIVSTNAPQQRADRQIDGLGHQAPSQRRKINARSGDAAFVLPAARWRPGPSVGPATHPWFIARYPWNKIIGATPRGAVGSPVARRRLLTPSLLDDQETPLWCAAS